MNDLGTKRLNTDRLCLRKINLIFSVRLDIYGKRGKNN